MLPGLLLPLSVFGLLPSDEIAITKIRPIVSAHFLCLATMTVLHLKLRLFSISCRCTFLTSKLFPFFPLAPSLLAHFYLIPVTLANKSFFLQPGIFFLQHRCTVHSRDCSSSPAAVHPLRHRHRRRRSRPLAACTSRRSVCLCCCPVPCSSLPFLLLARALVVP